MISRVVNNSILYFGDFIADKRMEITPPSRQDTLFEENVRYAREAISHTVQALPRGASNINGAITSPAKMGAMRIHYIWTRWIISFFTTMTENEELDLRAQIAKHHEVGNCGEHAIIALRYLEKTKQLSTVELLQINHGDHWFVVIGRESGSSITNPQTWGKSAVIADPWARKYYPATELPYHLNDILTNTLQSIEYPDPLLNKFFSGSFKSNIQSIDFAISSRMHMSELSYILDKATQEEKSSFYSTVEADSKKPNPTYNTKKMKERIENYRINQLKVPIPPVVSEQGELIIQKQLKEYQNYKCRADTHESLQELAKKTSVASAIGSFALAAKMKGRFAILSGVVSVSSYYSSNFFANHAQMYKGQIYQPWQ